MKRRPGGRGAARPTTTPTTSARLLFVAVAGLLAVGLPAVDAAAEGAEGAAAEAPSGEKVHALTDEDFDARVGEGQESPWFVKFYAPWCGHCKALEPTWDHLARTVAGIAKVAKVDATQAHSVSDDYDVDGYPTLKMIAEGKVYTFSGKRNAEELEAFARGGWREADAEPLPKDQPARSRIWRRFKKLFWTYGIPLTFVLGFAFMVWTLFALAPDEEEQKRRLEFDKKLEEYEKRIAEKRQRADSSHRARRTASGVSLDETEDEAATEKDGVAKKQE